ncbi:hypothetical protein [Nitratiruptor sp. SB155-2]|uniref:hypothetical protein n=1 Tax=Nitratiruptor sp. (strain SB155-2) TaxID=387092 RepID=UPI0001587051|nr:hypothetical protein [Nitratiruptor sp. SB155-2]BAF69975.1 hypothetical protein NIS_0863 [Nitratiruptor sp. SB155-2]
MGFKKGVQTQKIIRFKEFDEARDYIENFQKYHQDNIYAAIDYMISHKEYYFLLKNLLRHQQNGKIEKFVEYLFSRLECLKRNEDRKLLKQLLQCRNTYLQEKTFSFIINCCETFDISDMLEDYEPSLQQIELIVNHLECESIKKYTEALQKKLLEKYRLLSRNKDAELG